MISSPLNVQEKVPDYALKYSSFIVNKTLHFYFMGDFMFSTKCMLTLQL